VNEARLKDLIFEAGQTAGIVANSTRADLDNRIGEADLQFIIALVRLINAEIAKGDTRLEGMIQGGVLLFGGSMI
jgi:hypothetical protein